MSEVQASYQVNSGAATLAEFGKLPCCLSEHDPNYRPPTSAEIRMLKALTGWSQNDMAILSGVAFNPKKGSSTVRKWASSQDRDSNDHRNIEPVRWRMLLLCAGIISIDDQMAMARRGAEFYVFDFIQGKSTVASVTASCLISAESKAGLQASDYDYAIVNHKSE